MKMNLFPERREKKWTEEGGAEREDEIRR